MRKKYLSALLFGALLLASAGTFTSCKDYDDDIKNLQEQINTVKTSLDELTSKVNSLGAGVTDFKYENGQLVVVTDKGTNFTVDVAEFAGVAKLEIKDGVLYADGEAVGSVAGDGGSVVEVKDGVIYIDGEAKAEIGNKVAVVDNGNGTYTLTVDGKEYTLPKAVATDVTVTLAFGSGQFTEYGAANADESKWGIYWGTAAKDASWDGPKGAVKAGQFLVGAISTNTVNVKPATTELDEMDLKLVDSEGNYAPVTVKAVPYSFDDVLNSNGRATSPRGQWVLSIVMDETVNEKNAGSVFTTKNYNGEDKNKLFALSCDGRLLSGYQFVIDTKEEIAKSEDVEKVLKNNFASQYVVIGSSSYYPEGQEIVYYSEAPMETSIQLEYNHPQAYDCKYTISAEDQNDAEVAGIKVENNVLVGAATAAGQGVSLDLTVMGINGVTYTYKNVARVWFGNTVVDAEELAESTYKVPVNGSVQSVVINLGNTFSGLSAAQAVSLTDLQWSLASGEENTYLADKANLGTIEYFSDAECKNPVDVSGNDWTDNVKTIKFVKFSGFSYNEAAKTGVHKLQLKLMSGGDEVKKVIAPVNVTIPTFDEMFTKSAAWNEGVAQLRLSYAGVAEAMTLYKTAAGFVSGNATIEYDQVDNKAIISNELNGTITDAIINDNHGLKSTKAELTYEFAGIEGFTVKSGKFDVNFKSYLDGAVIKNLAGKDGAEVAFEVSGDKATFTAATVVLNNMKADNGLTGVLGEATLIAGEYTYSFDAKAGNKAVAKFDNGDLTVEGLAAGEYETTLTITYKQAVNGKAVYVSMPIKLTVKN